VDTFDRVVAALLNDIEPEVLEPHLCVARDALTGRTSVVARVVPGKEDDVVSWLANLQAKRTRGAPLDLALVGGDAALDPRLREALGDAKPDRAFHLLHIRDDHTVETLRTAKRPGPLATIAPRVDELPAVDFEQLQRDSLGRITATRRALGEQKTFQLAMQARRPWLVWALLGGIFAMFVVQTVLGNQTWVHIRLGALDGDRVRDGELWRLWSCTFLHHGLGHLVLNGFSLYVLGSLLERLLGASRFALIYVVSAAGAGLASAWSVDGRVSVGASGAIFGLLGAGAVVAFRPGGLIPASVVARARSAVVAVLVANLFLALVPSIDAWAHVGGALTGAALMVLRKPLLGLGPVKLGPAPPAGPLLRIAGGAAFGVLVAAEVVALANGRPWDLTGPDQLARRTVAGWSVALPRWVGDTKTSSPEIRSTEVSAGRLGRDPAHIQLTLIRAETELTPDEVRRELEAVLRPMLAAPPDGEVLDVGPLDHIGPWRLRSAAYTEAEGAFRHDRAFGVSPFGFARVGVATLPSDAARFDGLARQILTSIVPAEAPY
jgi:membrane associated rhomboid family serine protease